MTKVKLNYEDRQYFHPSPTPKMIETIEKALPKLNWQIDASIEKLSRQEAKELIRKIIRTAKRKGVNIWATEIDEINEKLDLITN